LDPKKEYTHIPKRYAAVLMIMVMLWKNKEDIIIAKDTDGSYNVSARILPNRIPERNTTSSQ
jgi:hypothetical protein